MTKSRKEGGGPMKDFDEIYVNDESELPEMSEDFAENAKEFLRKRDERDSLLEKRLGEYGADLAIRILERNPHLPVEKVIEQVELMT